MEITKNQIAESMETLKSADIIITLTSNKLVWWKRLLIWLGFMKSPIHKFTILKNRFGDSSNTFRSRVNLSTGVMDMDCDEIDNTFLSPKTRHDMKTQTYDPLLCPTPKPMDFKGDM